MTKTIGGSQSSPGRLSGLDLYVVAAVCMAVDHVGHCLGDIAAMRVVGRLAFPIFMFLLVEGFRHTSDIRRYVVRCLAAAVVSEVPYDMAMSGSLFDAGQQNVMWTMVLALTAMYWADRILARTKGRWLSLPLVPFVITASLADCCNITYRFGGQVLAMMFWVVSLVDGKTVRCIYYVVGLVVWSLVFYPTPIMFGWLPRSLFSVLSVVFIGLYDGTPGRGGRAVRLAKYGFYLAHLLVLGAIVMLFGRT